MKENSKKEIYAALEISDRYVRLIVGEYFNTRFNIIRVEHKEIKALEDFNILDKETLVTTIKEMIANCDEKIGAKLKKVILLIPSVNFKRYPLKVSVHPKDGSVKKSDIERALHNALHTAIDHNLLIINAVCIKYTCNGISYRRLPENERADSLIVDIDLLCADKSLAYDYVSIVEESGLEILDIMLDMYAICKEAALFEQTVNQNIVLVKIDYDTCSLALVSKGKLLTCDILYEGLGKIIDTLENRYHLPFGVNDRLVKYNTNFLANDNSHSAIFAWRNSKGDSKYITQADLSLLVKDSIYELAAKIKDACQEIFKTAKTDLVITGEGAKLKALVTAIEEVSKVETKAYFPETIGVRSSSYTALLGAVYGYRDHLMITGDFDSSINLLELNDILQRKSQDHEGETLTTRIRNLFDPKKGGIRHE